MIYNLKKVARELGMHYQNAKHQLEAGHLVPRGTMPNGELVFTDEDVRVFRRDYQGGVEDVISAKEISEKYGVPLYTVRRRIGSIRHVHPISQRGNTKLYDVATISVVADGLGWTEDPPGKVCSQTPETHPQDD